VERVHLRLKIFLRLWKKRLTNGGHKKRAGIALRKTLVGSGRRVEKLTAWAGNLENGPERRGGTSPFFGVRARRTGGSRRGLTFFIRRTT